MIGGFVLFAVAAVAAQHPQSETFSTRCAMAVAAVVGYVATSEKRPGIGSVADVVSQYTSVLCIPSGKDPDRTFVFLHPPKQGVGYFHSRKVYVASSSGEVSVQTGIRCEDFPDRSACE